MEDSTTQTAEKFMQDVRRKTRRKFTAEENIRIVLEGMKRELTVTEPCRRGGSGGRESDACSIATGKGKSVKTLELFERVLRIHSGSKGPCRPTEERIQWMKP